MPGRSHTRRRGDTRAWFAANGATAVLADGVLHFEGVLPGEVESADEVLAGIGCWGWTSARRWQDPVCGEGQQRQFDEEQPDDDQQHLGHTPHDRHTQAVTAGVG